MKKAGLGFVLLSLGLPGCVAERMCPSGEMLEGDACVTADGGMTGDDAPASCEVPCGGDTPHCVGGACVACRDDADCASAYCVEGACVRCREDTDCDASAPICDTGACVSCEGQDCTADQIADELAALVCLSAAGAVRSNFEGIDPAQMRVEEDAASALACAYPAQAPILGVLLDGIREGRTTVDFTQMSRCLDDAASVSGQLVFLALANCETGITGTVSNGSACASSFDCASGYCAAGGACTGTCGPRVADGMPCVDDAQCVSGFCSGGTCVAAPRAGDGERGEPCSGGGDCIDELVCLDTSLCGDLPGAGMACDTASFLACAAGTYCDGSLCQARIAMGEPCTDAGTCIAGTRCEGTPSRCLPVVAAGAPCGDDVACPAGTACVDEICAPLPTIGERCTGACYRGTCISGTCRSSVVGAACAAGLRIFDALDPCGEGSTCRRTGGTWTCEANVAMGATCGFDAYCDEPTATCSEADTCDAPCTL